MHNLDGLKAGDTLVHDMPHIKQKYVLAVCGLICCTVELGRDGYYDRYNFTWEEISELEYRYKIKKK